MAYAALRGAAMTIRLDHPTDPDAFLRWLERQDHKYELVDGKLIMMVGVTRNHARIATNLLFALKLRLNERQLDVFVSDFGVKTRRGVRYPDIIIEPPGQEAHRLASVAPLFLAEILSPSTQREDFERKPAEYMALPSLSAYLVLSQDEPRVWLWRRSEAGWPDESTEIEGLDAAVEIEVAATALSLPLAEIYAGLSQDG
jgi:Uma2 family endonuclease